VYGIVLAAVLVLVPSVSSVGVVAAHAEARQATVTAPRTARVLRVAAQPGDSVRAGDILVALDPTGADIDLAIARAELRTLQVNAIAEELDLRGSDLLSSARLAQEAERATVDLAALSSEEKRDRAELAQLDSLIARQQQLVDAKIASSEQRDQLVLQRSSVAQRVVEYDALLTAARAHEAAARDRLRAWRVAREKGGPAGLPLAARTAPGLALAAAQEERVRQLELLRDQLVLQAPIAGRIAEVLVSEGDTARADQAVVVIVDDHPLRVIAWVEERAAHGVKIGDRASLRPSDRGGAARNGTVRALSPSIAELPARFRVVPTQPTFGRAVYISLEAAAGVEPPLPGQAFDVVFVGGS
jgi:hemolysin D